MMHYLRRASSKIENDVLENANKVFKEYSVPENDHLKVYLRLKEDGSVMINPNGQVGMVLLSDSEILKKVTSGEIFSIEDNV